MSKIIVADLEANGLKPTKMHCICFNELGTDNWMTLYDDQKSIEKMFKVLSSGYTYVFHNSSGYDYPVLHNLFGLKYYIQPDMIQDVPCQMIDTLALSRELNPDRIGGHGLKAWEERVTGHKPKVEDWEDQPIEVYVERCKADVELTGNVLEYLLKEAEVKL